MTKEEIIQEAYGELYDKIYTDENGFSVKNLIQFMEAKDIEFKGNLNRPKSLQGIENNNGWIKIESEDDLPNEIDDFWTIRKGTDKPILCRWSNITFGTHTHYQPIEKPKPPLF